MQLQDFDTLAQAKAHVERTLKSSDERMLNERGIFSLIGMQNGEALMQAIEASISIPARVKSWFKPSEKGIDISDPSALFILAGMVSANVLTQNNSDILSEYAYLTTQPFINSTEHDFQYANGTIKLTRVPIAWELGHCTVTTTGDCPAHTAQIYERVFFNDGTYQDVKKAHFLTQVSTQGKYRTACPSSPNLHVDNVYAVMPSA
jgi:hypothetical protein